MGQGTNLDGGRELEQIRQKDPLLGALIQRVIESVNHTAKNAGVSAVGQLPAPPPVDSTAVSGAFNATTNSILVSGEQIHAVHTHNAVLNRGIRYITEIDTDPSFPNPHPLPDTTSRSVFTSMPAKNANGDAVSYYMRVTPQMPGSLPQKPTVFGNLQGPTAIVLAGNTQTTLLTSQAAGTARPGQGGKGLGPTQARDQVGGPKRDLK